MDLPHSDDCFVMAFPAEKTEAFCEGHNQAFAYFGGVPRTMLYDNTDLRWSEIPGTGRGSRPRSSAGCKSHYLFAVKFGRPGKGNDKGNVEGLVGYARRNFMVPVPRAASWEELNAQLLEQCRQRRERKLRGHAETIGERFERDQEKLLPLPAAPYEACEKRPARVSSQALVRYRDQRLLGAGGLRTSRVLVKAFVWEVVICLRQRGDRAAPAQLRAGGDDLRSAALPGAAGAKDQRAGPGGAACRAGSCRTEFAELRRLMEARLGQARAARVRAGAAVAGDVPDGRSSAAIRQALSLRAISFDAVKHLVLCADRAAAAEAGPGELSAPAAGASGADPSGRLPGAAAGGRPVMDTPQVLLEHHLKQLQLPTMLREYVKLASSAPRRAWTFHASCFVWWRLEMLDRDRRATERRIKAAKFSVVKSLDTFDFLAIPSLNKKLVLELARCEWIERKRERAVPGQFRDGEDPHRRWPWAWRPASEGCGSASRPRRRWCMN